MNPGAESTEANQIYAILADITVGVHFVIALFVILGEVVILTGWIAKWNWTRNFLFRLAHLATIGIVVLQAWLGIWCPLTTFENYLRRRAGVGTYDESFIGYWAHRLLFYEAPPWVFIVGYTIFGLIVLMSYIGYPPRRVRKSDSELKQETI